MSLVVIGLLTFTTACGPSVEYPVIGGVYVLERLVSDREAILERPWTLKAVRIDNIVDGMLLVKYLTHWEKSGNADFLYRDDCDCFESTESRRLAPEYNDNVIYIKRSAPHELAIWWNADGGEREGPFRYVMTYVDAVDLSMHRHPNFEDGFGLFGRTTRLLPGRDGYDRTDYPPAADIRPLAAGTRFRDRLRSGVMGPEMAVIPAGRFHMGALSFERPSTDRERPVREVVIERPFALSVYELTFEHYDRSTHPREVDDAGWGRGWRPVVGVSWQDAWNYVEWLSSETGEDYRLPTEAEWEYAARAETTTVFSWGDEIGEDRANCPGCVSRWHQQTAPVGWFAPNAFGLYDVHGNVAEWVRDCWNEGFAGAPSDATAWLQGDCGKRVLRGGSWFSPSGTHYSASRDNASRGSQFDHVGIRVARTLDPDV